VFGELSCWFAFGLWKTDIRLITLAATGVLASLLMLSRARRANLSSAVTVEAVDAADCRA
jgi:hypothetical protein